MLGPGCWGKVGGSRILRVINEDAQQYDMEGKVGSRCPKLCSVQSILK